MRAWRAIVTFTDEHMRLAHFIQRYPPALGGAEAYFARLSRYCVEQGDDVTVFTSQAIALEAFWSPTGKCAPAGTEADAGLTIHRYPLWRMRGRRWLLKPLSLVPLRQWQCLTLPCNPIAPRMWHDAGHAPFRFDAVHASAFPYTFPMACARRLARRLRVPLYLTPFLHLGDPDDPRDRTRSNYTAPALRWLLHEADGVFVQTPSERDAVRRLGLPENRIILQGLGVEPRECTGGYRADGRMRWQLPDEAFVIGHLANNSAEKGTNDLLAALEPLWHQNLPIYLLLAGPVMPNFERYWVHFEQRCPELARRYVRRLDAISDAVKRDFFAAIDTFALPSRSDSFGLVLLEAWANGIPNIAYRAGGITDVIRHERDGLLVPCGSSAGLTQALQRLYEDVRMRENLGRTGQARLPIDFCWEEKLALVRATIGGRLAEKKTRTEETSRTLPTLPASLRSE
jgi:glycosyltransferase involved in cell wall biosynthesis